MDPQYVYNTYDMDTTHKYTPGNIIGEGAFGNVRIGKHNSTGTNVAMKYVKVVARERIIPKAVFREIEALRQLSACRSIVKLYDVFAHETNICLVFEYLETDLGEIISCAKQHFPLQYIKTYIHMMLEPVCYCHKHNIIHRDIKPSNILVNSMGQLKLADFGLARVLPKACTSLETNNVGVIDNDAQCRCESLSHQVATRWYRAPELLFASRHYDFAVDMWALGAIFGDLYSLQPLFPGHNDIDQINKVFQIMGTPNETYWPDAQELPDFKKIMFPDMEPMDFQLLFPHMPESYIVFIKKFLVLDAKLRITSHDALYSNSKFFFEESPPMCPLHDLPKPSKRSMNK